MSDGVTVTVVLTCKPEDIEGFCTRLPEMLEGTRTYAGFRDVRVLRNMDNPDQIILIEDWDTAEAYQAYVAWRTETGAMDGLQAIIVAPPQTDFWDKRVA